MQLHGNEITIYRGEAFTISKIIRNRDGTPYIIGNGLTNSYFLLSISDSLYSQTDRYVKNYWLPIEGNIPTFYCTRPISLSVLKSSAEGEPIYNSFDEVEEFPINAYIDGTYCEISPEYAVFYEPSNPNVYKYWNDGWKDYECRIIKSIDTNTTKEWVSKTYLYSIQLVTGELGELGLRKINSSIPILPPTKLKVNNNVQGDIL